MFRVIFCKDSLITKDMTLMAPTEQDMNEWIRALRLHQIDLFRSRSSIFEQWLTRQGVKVPTNTISAAKLQFIEDGIQDSKVLDGALEEEHKSQLL